MYKITIEQLAFLLSHTTVEFSFTTIDGREVYATGTNFTNPIKTIDCYGNLAFTDIVKNDFRFVHKNSTIKTKLDFNLVNKDELLNLLDNNLVKFKYIKKNDDERVAYGTTDKKRIAGTFDNHANTSRITYWDLEKSSIKSASIDKNLFFEVLGIYNLPLSNENKK